MFVTLGAAYYPVALTLSSSSLHPTLTRSQSCPSSPISIQRTTPRHRTISSPLESPPRTQLRTYPSHTHPKSRAHGVPPPVLAVSIDVDIEALPYITNASLNVDSSTRNDAHANPINLHLRRREKKQTYLFSFEF